MNSLPGIVAPDARLYKVSWEEQDFHHSRYLAEPDRATLPLKVQYRDLSLGCGSL